MENFTIQYYMKTTERKPRVLRFERQARFQSTPHRGATLSLEGDVLVVDHITFEDNGLAILTVRPFLGVKPADVADTIHEMVHDSGWILASDTGRRKNSHPKDQ